MVGWQIFKHAVVMLWSNKSVAIKLALVPFLIAVVLITAILAAVADISLMSDMLFPESPFDATPDIAPDQLGGFFFGMLVFVLLSIVFTIWVVVAWHRFILLEETPGGWIAPFHGDRVLSYIGQLLKLVLIAFVVMIPIGFLFVAASQNIGLLVIVGSVVGLATSLLFFRISIILPASAIGKPMKIGEAWHATEGAFVALFLVIIAMVATQFVLQFIVGVLSFVPVLGFAANLIVSFAIGMLNASLLTTLYGHFVEGRDL